MPVEEAMARAFELLESAVEASLRGAPKLAIETDATTRRS
jgi:hypothetical protein